MRVRNILFVLFLVFTCNSCQVGLDYENENAISPDNVWTDANMINGYLNDIHAKLLPGWQFNASASDEGFKSAQDMNSYLLGTITISNTAFILDYSYVDRINFFLANLKEVKESVLSSHEKKLLEGQAMFWRAWLYFYNIKHVGGVPLILEPQDIANLENLYIPRSSTSDCIAQVLSDLDVAIDALPGKWENNDKDYGRITKAAAMSFKGQVLLWYASPLFNPNNSRERWEEAYKANKDAIDFMNSEGYGLYPDFKQLWYDERNKEVIMVNQYYYPGHSVAFNAIRPEPLTKDAAWGNQPSWNLLMAFPKRDGSPMNVDVVRLKNDPQYNQEIMMDFYMNRDDRFYSSIWCGGTQYPTPDVFPGYSNKCTFWNAWRWQEELGKYLNLAPEYNLGGGSGTTGFCDRKGLDTTCLVSEVYNGQTDWIVMRYAEILMNLGECANEIGKKDEALAVLYDIRKRAGIESGINGRYGVTAVSTEEIREAYINERFVEFAYEGKRFEDLRRLKRFDILNNQKHRHALFLVIKEGAPLPSTDETIYDPEVRKSFQFDYVENIDGDPNYGFNLSTNHWFYPLSENQIAQSMNTLEQNNEWGGTFDPLK